jgi:hypothetical protein
VSFAAFSIHPDDVLRELDKYRASVESSESGDYIFTLYIDKERFGMESAEPFRLDIERFERDKHYDNGCIDAKEALCFSERLVKRLVHGTFSPECYALIIPEKAEECI